MASKFRLFTTRFALIIHIIITIAFLLACLAPYLNPKDWWFISFLGLIFPFLLLIIIFFLFFWIMIRFRFAIISLVALIIGWKSISVFFAFNRPHKFSYKKDPGTIRIATWNVARFIELKQNNNKGSQTRLKMMDLLKQQDADVLCLEEFFHSDNPEYYPNLEYVRKNLNYPYYYFSADNDGFLHYYGTIIFSRFPIIDSGLVRYPLPTLPEALVYADIKFNSDTFRVYATHLQSLQFKTADYDKINQIKNPDDRIIDNSKTILSKMKRGIIYRSIHADIVKQITGDSPYPFLLCGDFNDTPNSYTYFTIRSGLQDAFLAKGFGIGRTFFALSPTLRIDYIFATGHFSILQYNRLLKNYSDHYMILADVKLNK